MENFGQHQPHPGLLEQGQSPRVPSWVGSFPSGASEATLPPPPPSPPPPPDPRMEHNWGNQAYGVTRPPHTGAFPEQQYQQQFLSAPTVPVDGSRRCHDGRDFVPPIAALHAPEPGHGYVSSRLRAPFTRFSYSCQLCQRDFPHDAPPDGDAWLGFHLNLDNHEGDWCIRESKGNHVFSTEYTGLLTTVQTGLTMEVVHCSLCEDRKIRSDRMVEHLHKQHRQFLTTEESTGHYGAAPGSQDMQGFSQSGPGHFYPPDTHAYGWREADVNPGWGHLSEPQYPTAGDRPWVHRSSAVQHMGPVFEGRMPEPPPNYYAPASRNRSVSIQGRGRLVPMSGTLVQDTLTKGFCVFVRACSKTTTLQKDALANAFMRYAKVLDCHVPTSQTIAFVTMPTREEAQRAGDALNECSIDGVRISCCPAIDKHSVTRQKKPTGSAAVTSPKTVAKSAVPIPAWTLLPSAKTTQSVTSSTARAVVPLSPASESPISKIATKFPVAPPSKVATQSLLPNPAKAPVVRSKMATQSPVPIPAAAPVVVPSNSKTASQPPLLIPFSAPIPPLKVATHSGLPSSGTVAPMLRVIASTGNAPLLTMPDTGSHSLGELKNVEASKLPQPSGIATDLLLNVPCLTDSPSDCVNPLPFSAHGTPAPVVACSDWCWRPRVAAVGSKLTDTDTIQKESCAIEAACLTGQDSAALFSTATANNLTGTSASADHADDMDDRMSQASERSMEFPPPVIGHKVARPPPSSSIATGKTDQHDPAPANSHPKRKSSPSSESGVGHKESSRKVHRTSSRLKTSPVPDAPGRVCIKDEPNLDMPFGDFRVQMAEQHDPTFLTGRLETVLGLSPSPAEKPPSSPNPVRRRRKVKRVLSEPDSADSEEPGSRQRSMRRHKVTRTLRTRKAVTYAECDEDGWVETPVMPKNNMPESSKMARKAVRQAPKALTRTPKNQLSADSNSPPSDGQPVNEATLELGRSRRDAGADRKSPPKSVESLETPEAPSNEQEVNCRGVRRVYACVRCGENLAGRKEYEKHWSCHTLDGTKLSALQLRMVCPRPTCKYVGLDDRDYLEHCVGHTLRDRAYAIAKEFCKA